MDNTLTEIGLDWLCHSDNTDVRRPGGLARYWVRLTYGTCKNRHWYLASTTYNQPASWPGETQTGSSNPDYLVHITAQTKDQRQATGRSKKGKKTIRPTRASTNSSTSQQPSVADVHSPTLSDNPAPTKQTRSLYPASIVGLAMIGRGEIGYLIASVAETGGLFRQPNKETDNGNSEIYLVVVWAITLCTIVGPICVGTLVKRVKTLQAQRSQSGSPDPLGVWGVS
jgi:hypothetical protein